MLDHGLEFGWGDLVVFDLNVDAKRLAGIEKADVDVTGTLKEQLRKFPSRSQTGR